MSQDIHEFVPSSCDLLALGEPTHRVTALGEARNEIFARSGRRAIILETDRIAAFAVDDYVRHGIGDLDTVMRDGFTHDFGSLDANRGLVTWMHDHNRDRTPDERLAFHGFDAPTENTTAPSPRPYLSYVRDYLGLDLEIEADDERWGREEAILDHTRSMGATAEATRLREIGEDLRTRMYASAPALIARTSRERWLRARAYLFAGLGLLQYHWQASRPLPQQDRIALLLATRDTLMARNLMDIRATAPGPLMVSAHNLHLRRDGSTMGGTAWSGAGAIVGAVSPGGYYFVAGSLGQGDPEPDTYEGLLQDRVDGWGLVAAASIPPARIRDAWHGYFPLDRSLVDGADAILHVDGSSPAS